ncbi:ras-related protein Rab-28 isoform X2 [Amyelois transitella]|uniref:ras-related protein Rab-28 isoform X2 n=1 Tax=Amyelois transitella TaxID=680683 RepID=UPI0029902E97|nr:ras-related protein Rab-28 isoform X2 [Amyelois transitella]
MSDTEDEDGQSRTIKITVVGEPATGKSSLCSRYLGSPACGGGGTSGADVLCGQSAGLRPPVPVQLCDVAGNAIHTAMLANYLYSSDIVIFVYDLTNLQSFERLALWVVRVKEIFEREPKKPLLALFGNKSELEHQRAVRLSCVQKFASEHLLENFKGSARTGEMVNTAFAALVSRVAGPRAQPAPAGERAPARPLSGRAVPSHSLIMNRKALRRFKRGATSSICKLQ